MRVTWGGHLHMLDGAWSRLPWSGSRAQGGHRKWRWVAGEGEHLLHWLLVTHTHNNVEQNVQKYKSPNILHIFIWILTVLVTVGWPFCRLSASILVKPLYSKQVKVRVLVDCHLAVLHFDSTYSKSSVMHLQEDPLRLKGKCQTRSITPQLNIKDGKIIL